MRENLLEGWDCSSVGTPGLGEKGLFEQQNREFPSMLGYPALLGPGPSSAGLRIEGKLDLLELG